MNFTGCEQNCEHFYYSVPVEIFSYRMKYALYYSLAYMKFGFSFCLNDFRVWGSCFKFLSKSFKIAVPEKWKICVIIQIVLRKKSCPLWQLRNQLRNISYFFSCALTCVFICLRNSCKSVSSQVNFCFQSFLFINCIKHTLKGKQVKQVWHTWSGWGDRRPVKEQIFAFSSGRKALQWHKYFKYLNIKLTKHDGILCRV